MGKVSDAEELRIGQWWFPKGEGDVGVIRPGGRGVNGDDGVKHEASLSNIWRMLWMTSPAPEHLSARSFLERKHRAFPFIWNLSMSIFSKSNSLSQYWRNWLTSSRDQVRGSDGSPPGSPLLTCDSRGDGGGCAMKGLGYRHNRSGENGRGSGRRSIPVGS